MTNQDGQAAATYDVLSLVVKTWPETPALDA
ncbi:hypothetical protein BJ999_005390 [Actinomadura citrea]|uniref:Uncharacterized protein n=1 Tax=Actinomadura citrea TaxID=46158 RepID=A0A7Y9GEM0_9ACTN|nr:hypothetical protein [Actinomadura citrea]